ncbi:hypothetical protein ABZT03_34620 [Streptomyces sp. NPDC005574]|uniref:hypothetical protein n=1 Tax=Streptomyces sp. NPDC005574 TaxID=3156891 RepID=UPI0033BEA074
MPNDVLENPGSLISPYGVAGEVRELTYSPGEPKVLGYGSLAVQVQDLLDEDPPRPVVAAAVVGRGVRPLEYARPGQPLLPPAPHRPDPVGCAAGR